MPAGYREKIRQDKGNGLVVGVDQQEKFVVDDSIAFFILLVKSVPGQIEPEAAGKGMLPFLVGHFRVPRGQPDNVPDTGTLDETSLEKISAAKPWWPT